MPELVQIGHMNPGRWESIARDYVALGMSPGPVDLEGFIHAPQASPDYGLVYRIVAVSLFALLVIGGVTLRFARLNQTLKDEVLRREAAEEQLRQTLEGTKRQASTDPLTGIWNRMHFTEVAEAEVAEAEVVRSNRYHYPLSLLFIDIDHFKQINDQYGHATGDHVLRTLAHTITDKLRQSDTFCRWGGEEFLILMPHTALEHAMELGELMRERVANTPMLDDRSVTISVGVASLRQGDRLEYLVHLADQALYCAKSHGRNRVETRAECAPQPSESQAETS